MASSAAKAARVAGRAPTRAWKRASTGQRWMSIEKTGSQDGTVFERKNGVATRRRVNRLLARKNKNPKAPKLFPDELIDQLLAWVRGKDAESMLGESRLAGPVGRY